MEEEQIEGKKPIRMSKKASKVRNKAPAQVQITAEQLLREARERDLEAAPAPPRQKLQDQEEVDDFKRRKRKDFEDNIRKNRTAISNWIRYAKWEESVGELLRARSVFERALDIDHRNIGLWLQYAELEMRQKQINHARNIWDRCVTLLPRASQFWLKYVYMEEMLENVPGARQVFERWMEWEPAEQAWQTYINFEMRYREVKKARQIWQRFLHVHGHEVKNWIRYAKWEQRNGFVDNARQVYERAIEYFGEENLQESLLVAFAKFEEYQKEHERARVVYRYALDHLPGDRQADVFKHYTVHEKKYGEKAGIENVIVSKRRNQYEQQIAENCYNYDAWFDYLRLLENEDSDTEEVRDTYERAIANVPPEQEKRYWRRYIYLWINYVLYEELIAKDVDRAREVYKMCLNIIPHKKFTFAKLWLMFAQFEIRQKDLKAARKILGTAIGKCPKDKLFRGYIELELELREFDRCRLLYEKRVEWAPENCTTWIKFAELETLLGDVDRARALYELAVAQPLLDMPEVLWKAYIDFEIGQEEYDRTRKLYHRLLQKTRHVKVWVSFAQFEMSAGAEEGVARARDIFSKANRAMKNGQNKQERLMLLENWMRLEEEHGTSESQATVQKELPRRVKKRRPIMNEDGTEATAGWEEYYDYMFPADEGNKGHLKLLALAKKWKQTEQPEADSKVTDTNVTTDDKQPDEEKEKTREGDSDTDMESDDEDGSSSSSSSSNNTPERQTEAVENPTTSTDTNKETT